MILPRSSAGVTVCICTFWIGPDMPSATKPMLLSPSASQGDGISGTKMPVSDRQRPMMSTSTGASSRLFRVKRSASTTPITIPSGTTTSDMKLWKTASLAGAQP